MLPQVVQLINHQINRLDNLQVSQAISQLANQAISQLANQVQCRPTNLRVSLHLNQPCCQPANQVRSQLANQALNQLTNQLAYLVLILHRQLDYLRVNLRASHLRNHPINQQASPLVLQLVHQLSRPSNGVKLHGIGADIASPEFAKINALVMGLVR